MRASTTSSGPRHQRPSTVRFPPLRLLVSHATIIFNSGAVALKVVLEGLGMEAGPLYMATLSARSKVHLQRSVRKAEEVAKKRRKRKKQTEMSLEVACNEEEGVTYETWAF